MLKKKKWKRFLAVPGIFFLCLAALMRVDPLGKTKQYEDFTELPLLRFHIRAESDLSIHQEEKMAVRREVLSYLQRELKEETSKEGVRHEILKRRREIEKLARHTLKGYQEEANVAIYFTKEFFPVRQYGQVIVPAGMYETLRIDIGKAKGRNWWCILYPNLCLIDPEHVVIRPEDKKELEAILAQGKAEIKYHSFLCEWLAKHKIR
jgi:stage II sporulation protein R